MLQYVFLTQAVQISVLQPLLIAKMRQKRPAVPIRQTRILSDFQNVLYCLFRSEMPFVARCIRQELHISDQLLLVVLFRV